MTTQQPQPLLLPGQPLPPPPAPSSSKSNPTTTQPSTGVYNRSEYTLSSLTGSSSYETKTSNKKSIPSTSTAKISTPFKSTSKLPEPDSIVLARITRITSRQALCSILLVLDDDNHSQLSLNQALASGISNHAAGEDPSGLDFNGVIRQQDVRLTETDKVKIIECFRVGDLVKAKVVSLGDSRSYYLTTASNELGVLFATASQPADVLPSSATTTFDPFLPSAFRQSTKQPAVAQDGQRSIPGALRPLNWQEMVDPATGIKEKRKVAKPEGL
ncbi:unnamed protein product [Sympodiomycopsis kandeliae]